MNRLVLAGRKTAVSFPRLMADDCVNYRAGAEGKSTYLLLHTTRKLGSNFQPLHLLAFFAQLSEKLHA